MSDDEYGSFDEDEADEYGSFDEDEAVEAAALADVTPARLRLQQKTLFGGLAQVQVSPGAASYSATRNRQRNRDEPPTHHRLDKEALKTWVFPTNYAQRDYQFNMIRKALFTNVLVALPTGLGKTFIAAVVMYNWYRWAPDSKIIFLAPAKPLVTQQIEACYHVCGIPAAQIAELTGGIQQTRRMAAYVERRVFFLTPQTFQNDLANGLIKAKDVSCLVIDEAHHATGNYAYVNVVQKIRAESDSFRILALTATPGKTVETVQEVVDALNISQIEIRSESSIDIRSYTHTKEIETVLIDLTSDIISVQDKYASLLKPMIQKLVAFGVGMTTDPTKLSSFGVREACNKLQRQSYAGRGGGNARAAQAVGGILSSLAYSMELLAIHGMRPFYDAMLELRAGVKQSDNKKKVVHSPVFTAMMQEMKDLLQDPAYFGHPKLDHLSGLILHHFQMAEEDGNKQTRVMIFSSLRTSAEVIVSILKQHSPLVKPTPFFGQQAGKSGSGMSQKEQQDTISKFKKGVFNVIVATSVGEEGLDIGEVDMIICYDSSSSPARMLQRMGRTGRKRDGRVFVLCVPGKEENAFIKAKDAHKTMQKKIEKGIDIKLSEDVHRIIPWNINPECEKRELKVPEGDKIGDLELTTMRRKKKQSKTFNMPDGVTTGFVSAGTMTGTKRKRDTPKAFNVDEALWDVSITSSSDLLTAAQERELNIRFRKLDDDADGCLRLRREEEGRFLSRTEIRAATKPVLVSHGQTMRGLKDLLHKRFMVPALQSQIVSYQRQISSGAQMTHPVVYADSTAVPDTITAASDSEVEAEEELGTQDDDMTSDADSYAGLGSFVNDEDVPHSEDESLRSLTPPPRMQSVKRVVKKCTKSSTADPLHIFSDSDQDAASVVGDDCKSSEEDVSPVSKKIRLSQLARDSDEDDLPDTHTAIQSAITSARKATQDRLKPPSIATRSSNIQKRTGIARSKIRIIEEEDDDF